MPTYEYKCGDCNHSFEEFKKISEKDNVECPKCEAKPPIVETVIQPVGAVLKGTGWFRDGYRGKK